jgi:SAM-dependent methyltransferase
MPDNYIAEYYNHHTGHFNQQDLTAIPSFAWMKKSLELTSGQKVLDAGCGTGYLLDFMTPKTASGFGVDISGFAIKTAKSAYPGLNFTVSDITKLPYKNNFFDRIYAFNVIEHIPDQKPAMQELKRVLKPGGIIVMGTNIKDSPSWLLFKLFLGGDPTHTREFGAMEFVNFVGAYFKVTEYTSSSCIARFSPAVNKIFHNYLKGDILVKAIK